MLFSITHLWIFIIPEGTSVEIGLQAQELLRWQERKVDDEQTGGNCRHKMTRFLGSCIKMIKYFCPWKSDGCHFETEPLGTLLHYEAYSVGSHLFNTTQAKEAPLTFSP